LGEATEYFLMKDLVKIGTIVDNLKAKNIEDADELHGLIIK
jgi:hypothetical protein